MALMESTGSRLTVGLDATARGWIAVVLVDGRFESAHLLPNAPTMLFRWPQAAAYGIDIPIGLLDVRRDADQAARNALRGRASSVFPAPCASAITQATRAEADRVQRELLGLGLSAQSWALKERIVDAAQIAHDPRVFEVHPELVFARLAEGPVPRKRSWNGAWVRRWLLDDAGIVLPDHIPSDGGNAPIDDVLDAAAGALAVHQLESHARRYPATPIQQDASGRLIYMVG